MDKSTIYQYMRLAYEQADLALQEGELPVGAVLILPSEIDSSFKVFTARNTTEADGSAIKHAEMNVIADALSSIDGKYLSNSTIFITLEPCAMCAGAIWASKIKTVYFGASDSDSGAAGSLFSIIPNRNLNHRPEVYGGIMEKECREILQNFFRSKR